jgi:hypothetical protein
MEEAVLNPCAENEPSPTGKSLEIQLSEMRQMREEMSAFLLKTAFQIVICPRA